MEKFLKKFSEFKKNFSENITDKKNFWIQQLEDIRTNIDNEINKRIDDFYKRKNLITEALSEKIKLKNKPFFKPAWKEFLNLNLRYLISAPFIYMMIIPAVILDICLEIYHRICFPLYWIETVKRKWYFLYDRNHLSYLNWFEKLNCIYCSYFNWLIWYAREIAWRTEKYWCPIKHAQRRHWPHDHYEWFTEYLEWEKYRENIENVRCFSKTKKCDK